MNHRSPQPARRSASQVLDRFRPGIADTSQRLERLWNDTDRPAHAKDLVHGVLRNLNCIDHVIETCTGTRTERIQKKLLTLIRIGTYELIYCPETAEYAVINEAASLTKHIAGRKQTAFVNACLRSIQRGIADRSVDVSTSPAARTVPVTQKTGCLLNNDIFPDPKTHPLECYSLAFSLPLWLIESWNQQFDRQKLHQICFASNRKPSVYLHPNTIKISLSELKQSLADHEIPVTSIENEPCLRLDASIAPDCLPGFDEGLFIIQDPTAASVVPQLAIQPESVVYDLCAAPGTKTAQLAMAMNNTGRIIATDINSKRLTKVSENAFRLGLNNIETVEYKKFLHELDSMPQADAILLDVPCSNTGVMARRVELRHRITPDFAAELPGTQLDILAAALRLSRTGTKILYSTCSIQAAENEDVIAQFIKQQPNIRCDEKKVTTPACTTETSFAHDGGFFAILTVS